MRQHFPRSFDLHILREAETLEIMRHRNRARKSGLPPGTLLHIGDRKVDHAKITRTDYDPEVHECRELDGNKPLIAPAHLEKLSWIEVTGLHDVQLLQGIGDAFGIHSLMLEDIANTDQRPKIDVGDSQVFIVVKMLQLRGDIRTELDIEQVSFILGRGYLLTFQEKDGDVFDSVRQRLRQKGSRLRKHGADYLAYALLDLVVDHYFVVLEGIADQMDDLEASILGEPKPDLTTRIHHLKRTLLQMRKATWPMRDMISSLLRMESPLVSGEMTPFLHDLHDHTLQVVDAIETHRDMLSGLLEVHLSNINNQLGAVMKVLTIIATIFIPLTFVAGVYGMNFDVMPELHWKWGYPIVLLFMFGIAAGLLVYFRIKKWL